MPDYKNGKIYKLVCNKTGLTYIGSTTKTLKERLCIHVSFCKAVSNGKIKSNLSSSQVIQGGDYQIELIEDFPCENRKQLTAREGFHVRNNDCVNIHLKIHPDNLYNHIRERQKARYEEDPEKYRQQVREWRMKNPEKVKESHKKWLSKNQERFRQTATTYYEENRERIRERNKRNYVKHREMKLDKGKEYRTKNKTKIKETSRRYREQNSFKVKCPCGSEVQKVNMCHHKRTKKHLHWEKNQEEHETIKT